MCPLGNVTTLTTSGDTQPGEPSKSVGKRVQVWLAGMVITLMCGTDSIFLNLFFIFSGAALSSSAPKTK